VVSAGKQGLCKIVGRDVAATAVHDLDKIAEVEASSDKIAAVEEEVVGLYNKRQADLAS